MKVFMQRVVCWCVVPAAAAIGLPATVLAQALEEITVTARKTEESLQDVPISVTAFSAEMLQDMGVRDNEEVAYFTVNFNNVQQLGRQLDRPVIRGQANPATFGEPNASFFIDGAFVSASISTLTMGPIERVEVLRGPQATQFGRATFSGAINYVTRKPTNEFAAETTVELASHDSSRIGGWASGPLIDDKLLFFASAVYQEYGGEWRNNLAAGTAGQNDPDEFIDPPQQEDRSDLGGQRTKSAEGKLLWNMTDSSDLTFKVAYIEGDDQHYPQLVVDSTELNCFVPGVDAPVEGSSPGAFCGVIKPNGRTSRLNIPDLRTGMTSRLSENPAFLQAFGFEAEDFIASGEDVGQQRDTWNTLIQYNQDISDWTLTAQLAYNTDDFYTAFDLDQTQDRPFSGLFNMYSEDDREDLSFETRIASPVDKPVRASLGFYYFDYEQKVRQKSMVGLGQAQLNAGRTNTTENIAVFGLAEWDFAEKWNIGVEARVARDTKEIKSVNVCEDPDSEFFDPNSPVTDKEETDALTPRFTLRYFPTQDVTLYAQAAKGNKPGGYNLGFFADGVDGCSAAEEIENGIGFVDEEKAWNYEVGAKTSWFENRLIANLSVYYIDWENQTVFDTAFIQRGPFQIPQAVAVNAGESEVYGLELETQFAITDKLTGTFAYGLTNGTLEEFESSELASLLDPDSDVEEVDENGNPIIWGDASGNTIPNSSKHNIVTSLSYVDTINAQLDWFARTDFSWESKKYTSATNTAEIDDRRRWNARTGLETEGWRLSVFVNNILDEQTPSAILGFPRLSEDPNAAGAFRQGYALTPTPGRSVGAEAIWRFGN
jgi:outer membrane receptor protein involved in Fe transport